MYQILEYSNAQFAIKNILNPQLSKLVLKCINHRS